jgi:hypothetical protein
MKILLSLLALTLASNRAAAQLTWEWTFDDTGSAPVLGDGLLDWSTPNAQTLAIYGDTDGTAVPHIGGTSAGYLRIPGYADPADFPRLTFNDSGANGGGAYINQYTVAMDVYIPGTHTWLPFFNTNPLNASGNDADFYVSPEGAIGIGALGYSVEGIITPDAWHRVVFAADLTAGVVTFYLDGTQIFQRVPGTALLDGRFSIYSAVDEGVDLILGNEGDTSGVYTREWLLSSFAFTDHTLTSEEVAALGAPKAAGIFYTGSLPPRPELQISSPVPGNVTLNWSQTGFTLQRSTDLVFWDSITGSAALNTYSEPATAPRVFFQLVTP